MSAFAVARGVTRRFGKVLALREAHLSVGPGEVVGLVGANGAGKTTLIRVLLGLISPTAGAVSLFGTSPSIATRARIGYVPQGLGLYPDLTVAENLAFVAAAYRARSPRLAGDLASFRDRRVADLPLGVQRRVAFALAAGHQPELLILDEPTSGVGPLGRVQLWDGIRRAADAGAGVLVSTHHMSEAEQCDRLVALAAGRVVAQGTVQEIVGAARVVRVRSDRWEDAFHGLDRAGFRLGLVGRSLRVVQASADAVRAALASAGIPAQIDEVPASFEEAFVLLASDR
ncbi:MAG: ABC transporter ATP-binding protein [Actinomycetota bacterium]|nr:ABC transporter ATP-binding protein [Actinomycetota bacterium]